MLFSNFDGTTTLYLHSSLKFENFSFTIFSLFSYTPNDSKIFVISIVFVSILYLLAICWAKFSLFGSDSFSGKINPNIFSEPIDFEHNAVVIAESIPPLNPITTPFFW